MQQRRVALQALLLAVLLAEPWSSKGRLLSGECASCLIQPALIRPVDPSS